MNSGDELPAESHVVREASAREAPADPDHPPTNAFRLRSGELDLSVRWLEFFATLPPGDAQLTAVCRCLCLNRRPNKSSRILRLEVDKARSLFEVIPDLERIQFLYTPLQDHPGLKDDPSHSSIFGIAPLIEPLQQLAAQMLALAVTNNWEWRDLQRRGIAPPANPAAD